MKVCKLCLVSGKVQGVFYRASTRNEARRLGLAGYARNLEDGRVEVLACGSVEDVERLVAWLRKGPPLARVENVEVREVNVEPPADFTTS